MDEWMKNATSQFTLEMKYQGWSGLPTGDRCHGLGNFQGKRVAIKQLLGSDDPITEYDFHPGGEEQGGGVCLAGHHPHLLRLLQDLLQRVLSLLPEVKEKVKIHFLTGAVSSWRETKSSSTPIRASKTSTYQFLIQSNICV